MTLVLGLSGKKRSGKNTVYFMLKLLNDEDETGKVVKVSMADALKEIARNLGWDGRKDERGRKVLQFLGTEVGRNIDSEYWTKRAEERIQKAIDRGAQVVVIPDIRFPNEVEMVRKFEGKLWRIRRPAVETMQNGDNHASETALDGYKEWDAILIGNDMTELFEAVKRESKRLGLDEAS